MFDYRRDIDLHSHIDADVTQLVRTSRLQRCCWAVTTFFAAMPLAAAPTRVVPASSLASYASFGNALAFDGEEMLVGANRRRGSTGLEGSVFRIDPESFSVLGEFRSPHPSHGGYFGDSISGNLTHTLIGAPGANGAYLFQQGGALRHELVSPNASTPFGFGGAVQLVDDSAYVAESAPSGRAMQIHQFDANSGAFVRTLNDPAVNNRVHPLAMAAIGNDLLLAGDSFAQRISTSTGQQTQRYDIPSGGGRIVDAAAQGNQVLLVTQFNDLIRGYLFDAVTANLQQTFRTPAIYAGTMDISVSIQGRYSLIGEYYDEIATPAPQRDVGVTYLVDNQTGTIVTSFSNPNTDHWNDHFGNAVFLLDQEAWVGARWDNNPGEDTGAVYVFSLPDTIVGGDFNLDNAVDALDYEVWRNTFGSKIHVAADGNRNGVVDAADFTVWRDQFGKLSGTGQLLHQPTPEPATSLLFFLAGILGWLFRGSRRNCSGRGSLWPSRRTCANFPQRLLLAVGVLVGLAQVSFADNAAVRYLGDVQDRFHRSFGVYDDISAAGNHFHTWAKIPEGAAVTMIGGDAIDPFDGATSIRATFANVPGPNFGGLYLSNGILQGSQTSPTYNFGTYPHAGIDLSGATAIKFRARGLVGGEKIEFFTGGIGRHPVTGMPTDPFPESFPRTPSILTPAITLGTNWQEHRISLAGRDLSYVLGGLGWVANDTLNPNGATFFLDKIEFELSDEKLQARLREPRFLRSFETRPIQPDLGDGNRLDDIHFVLRNAASSYDNAVAGLAFLAEGSTDSQRRARLIADAFVYATTHDRFFDDGRIRSFYAAGDIALPPGWEPNNRPNTVPIPGFFDEQDQRFYEVEQVASDTGNNAWPMIFLLQAYREFQDPNYRAAAERIGNLVRTFRSNEGTFPGFLGGVNGPESGAPENRLWASTEHNIDVLVASRLAYQVTGDPRWLEDARHASKFVESMYDESLGLYRTGTINPNQRNELAGQLPSDVNNWAILADPATLVRHPQLLDHVLSRFLTSDGGFTGIDFNDDRDGVQFEMTAHLVLALRMAGRHGQAQSLLNELNRAQATALDSFPGSIPAASRDGLTTGFDTASGDPFLYFQLPHVGSTAWLALAQLGINPYSLQPATFLPGDYDGNGIVNHLDYNVWKTSFGSKSNLAADGNGNLVIDAADYSVWRDHLGSRSSAVGGVPEPTSLGLCTLVVGAIVARWRRHFSRPLPA